MNQILEQIRYIYEDSFPIDERRSFAQLIDTFTKNSAVNIKIFNNETKAIGFIIYWRFSHFVFVEHFAFDSSLRGQGNGTKALREFVENIGMPVVLEVEPATDDLTARRIKFYERLGFNLHCYHYTQPPYDKTKNPVDMNIMSYNFEGLDTLFEKVKEVIYREVYNVKL